MSEVQKITNPIFNIFDPPIVDESIEKYEYIEYREKRSDGSGATLDAISDYEITNSDIDLYLLPSHSYIEVKIQCYDATALPNGRINTGRIALQNGGWNIFERAEYIINDNTEVENVRHLGIANQIKGLVEYCRDYSDTAANQVWFPDMGNGLTNYLTGSLVVSATAAAAATTLAILATGFVVTGVGVDDAAVTIIINAAAAAVEINNTGVTQALAINGAAQHIDFAGVVAGTTKIVLKPNGGAALAPFYQLYAGGRKIILTGNGTDIIALYEDGSRVGAIAAAGITATLVDPTAPSVPETNILNYNTGFDNRNSLLRTDGTNTHDKQITVYLPLRHIFQIWKHNQIVIRGCKHTIKLYKNSNANIWHKTSGTNDGYIKLISLSWWVPKVKPSIPAGGDLEQQLISGSINKLMYERIYMHNMAPNTSNSQNGYWNINSLGSKPVRAYLVFQTESQYTDQTGNKMIFKNMNVSRMRCELNKTQFPEKEYTSDFTDAVQDFSRLYMQYLDFGNNLYDVDSGPLVNYNQFGKLYPIFCFDFTKADPMLLQQNKNIDVEFFWEFRTAPPFYRAYILFELETNLEVAGVSGRMIFKRK